LGVAEPSILDSEIYLCARRSRDLRIREISVSAAMDFLTS